MPDGSRPSMGDLRKQTAQQTIQPEPKCTIAPKDAGMLAGMVTATQVKMDPNGNKEEIAASFNPKPVTHGGAPNTWGVTKRTTGPDGNISSTRTGSSYEEPDEGLHAMGKKVFDAVCNGKKGAPKFPAISP